MTRTTRLLLAAAGLTLLALGLALGLTPKEIHIAACGSPLFPADWSTMTHEAASECGYALGKRETLMWWLFIVGAALGFGALVAGRVAPPRELVELQRR